VLGHQAYHKINDTILNHQIKKKKQEETEFDAINKFEYLSKIKNQLSKVSSFLTIQEGCDKFCHFCVVPYTRGPEYSRPFDQVLDEAKQLRDNGTREIILLGQNVNAYNFDNYRLSNLILELEKLSGIERIRYTTSHPKDMTEDLIDVYKNTKKLMPLVHLPIQSGSDKILNLMNRKHSIKTYLDVFNKLKKINHNIEFSSDFIIAYPGEEQSDFEETIRLIDEIKFINSYSFIFSPRPGTVAADLQLIDKMKSMERLEIVQQRLFDNQINMNRKLENTIINVLVENRTEDKSKLFGRSEYMTSVLFSGSDDLIGKIVKIKIKNSNRNTLFGETVEQSNQKVA
jgi:tRNA-2-methylthio-N6-dimethylallyladenosine synthase